VSNDISRCFWVRLMRINFLFRRLGLEVGWAIDLRSPRSMARAARPAVAGAHGVAVAGDGRPPSYVRASLVITPAWSVFVVSAHL
jgi:hypothetical protein